MIIGTPNAAPTGSGPFQSLVDDRVAHAWSVASSRAQRLAVLHVASLFAALDAFGTLGFVAPSTAKRLGIRWRTGMITPSQGEALQRETDALLHAGSIETLSSSMLVSCAHAMLGAIGVEPRWIGSDSAFDAMKAPRATAVSIVDRASAIGLRARRTLVEGFAEIAHPRAPGVCSEFVEALVHLQLCWLGWEFRWFRPAVSLLVAEGERTHPIASTAANAIADGLAKGSSDEERLALAVEAGRSLHAELVTYARARDPRSFAREP